MANVDYSSLSNVRLSNMIENEVRAILADMASIRNSGALYFAGDIAGIGSDTISLRYANCGAATPFASASDGSDVSNTSLTDTKADITIARSALRYDVTDLAAMTGYGMDIDPFTIAAQMAASAEARMNAVIATTFSSISNSVGSSGVDMSVDDFFDAMFQLESQSNDGKFYCVLHPQQLSDLRDSLRAESNNALAFSPATEEMLKIKGQGFVGTFLGVDIFKSSYVTASAGNRIGAMFSYGGIGYAVGTPKPLPGAMLEQRPAGTPVVVAMQRDESAGLTEIVGHLYCGAAIVEDLRCVKIVTDQ